jgi:ABC-type protease/lipase transport system fused ATPase/permease subunit
VVENASVVPPGVRKPAVRDLSLKLQRGSGLGVIGPSGSGKSSLARMLVGYWAPANGKVCLDGASLDQWAPDILGRHIGYLPQHVELINGNVAQNISRFEPEPDPEAVRAAAATAGAHEMIVSLEDGYGRQIGERGTALSAGQAQRIALARALYRDPFLVVLDEPNSNLDAEGEAALTQAILSVRARGGIVVVIAHRPSAIAGVDLVLAMKEGRAVAFGPKDEVLAKVLQREPPRPLKLVPEAGSA